MECLFPVRIRIPDGVSRVKWSAVPCGKCYPCLQRNAAGWAVRLMAEHREAKSSHFITLTYDTENLPFDLESGTPCLQKSDLQKFFKRLRKRHKFPESILYYAVGEYGDQYSRPHYHAIVFNSCIPDIERSWGLGAVYYGSVTMNSVMYTLSYMLKYSNKKDCFRVSSKFLGLAYLTPEAVRWHTDDLLLRYFAPQKGGKKLSLPRYLKQLIYSPQERELIAKECADGQLWDNVDKTSLDYLAEMDILRNHFPIGYKPKKQNLRF